MKINYGKNTGKTGPRRFKIYFEPKEVTLYRAVEYLEKYGTATYTARLLDKLLLDLYPEMERDEIVEKELAKNGKLIEISSEPE